MKYIKHNNSYIRVKSGKAFLFSFIDKPTEYELPSIPKNPIYISKEEYEYGISQKISNKNPKYKLDEMKDKIVYNLLEYSDKLNEISDFFDSEIIHTLKILRKDSTTKPKKYYKKMANSKIACKIKILELMEDLDKLNDDEFEKTSRIITKLAIII